MSKLLIGSFTLSLTHLHRHWLLLSLRLALQHWTILNELGHGRSRDRKRGLVLRWPWVILDELGHGGTRGRKQGLVLYWPWVILNELGYGESRGRKQGLVLYWPWVILNELGHGGSGDQKRGLDMKAATLSSLRLCSTHCVPISANCRHNATCRDYLNNNGP